MATPISLPKGYQRLSGFPLDASSLFTSLSDLQTYASTNGTAYVGQICAVNDGTDVKVYKINTDKSVSELGSDGSGSNTVKISSDDTTGGYLEDKIIGTDKHITVTKENTGTNEDIKIDVGTDVTVQGNIFNGISQLVQTDTDGKLPAIDGSQLQNLPSGFADPMKNAGDIIIRNALNLTSRLPVGTDKQVIMSDGTTPSWQTLALTTGDVTEIADKRYVTNAELTDIANIKNLFDKLNDDTDDITEGINHLFMTTNEKNKIAALTNVFIYKGQINTSSDFPTLAQVQNGWAYEIKASVIDNDSTKTNTGISFSAGEVACWNGTSWVKLGIPTGNMRKETYDVNNNDIVDKAESINDGTISLSATQLKTAYDNNHTHTNKALLDTYDQTNANIKDTVTNKHSHINKSVLDKFSEDTDGNPLYNSKSIGSGSASIDDTATTETDKVWSANKLTSIIGTDNLLTMSQTLKEAINELFTSGVNVKSDVVTTVNAKAGVDVVTTNNTWSEIEDAIMNLSGAGNATMKSTGKFTVANSGTKDIVLSSALSINNICATVLEWIQQTGVAKYTGDFLVGDSSGFNYNNLYVTFDGYLHCNNTYTSNMSSIALGSGTLYSSIDIDKSLFNSFSNFAVAQGINTTLTMTASPLYQLITMNSDIDLNGVSSVDSITWTATSNNTSSVLMILSFDSGNTWQAYNGSSWITVTTLSDVYNHGMNSTIVASLNSTIIESARNGNNVMRIGYLINQVLVTDTAQIDKTIVTVTNNGYYQLASTSKYSYAYNQSTKTITITFSSTGGGTYNVNYRSS